MTMMNKPGTLAGALLCLAALSLSAQEEIDFTPPGQIVPVADEGPEEGVDVDGTVEDYSVPELTGDDLLSQEFGLYVQLMRDGVFDEADTVAKRVVELSMRLKGPQSNEAAKALTNLAIVQHQTGQFDAAAQNFQSSIDIIEEIEDRLHAQLINPLKGLGASQLESGRADLAIGSFQRAVHVSHVNEGPHNLDQVELLESLAETNLRIGDFKAAKEAQDVIYALYIREHDLDTMELVPSLMRRAAWQHRAGFIYDERTTYRRVVRIIESNTSKTDLRLVEPLIRLGKSHFFIDTSGSESIGEARLSSGEIYFRRAVKIAVESPEQDWKVIAQATLALADFYMYENNLQRAHQVYTAAWELLSQDESRLDVRKAQLESGSPIIEQRLPRYVNSEEDAGDDSTLQQGRVAVTYNISVRGRVANLKMVEANPPEFTNMQRHVQRELRRRVFRPVLVDGDPVESAEQILEHTFFYRQADLDALRAETDPAGTDAET
jgi:tetratricopeptide (TPR) repeat protein